MNGPEFLTAQHAEIEQELQLHNPRPEAPLPAISPWLAKSLLQKAVRRGRTDLALAAARVMMQSSPHQLWRKLVAIAIGEVGLGDLDAVNQTFTVQADYARLVERFGPWKPVELVVSRLASAAKCRAIIDLNTVIDSPAWSRDRTELSQAALPQLLEIFDIDAPIERSAIAMRLAIETPETSIGRSNRVDAVFDCMREAGSCPELTEIARQACHKAGQTNAAYLCLLYRLFDGSECELRDDAFPPETEIQGLPSWTLDRHCREGKAALGRLLETDCPTSSTGPSRHRPRTRSGSPTSPTSGPPKDGSTLPLSSTCSPGASSAGR